jgi:site-specific recombinase
MVETIVPVVHGERRRRYIASVVLHTLGAVLAAGAFGALLGLVGQLLGAPWGVAGAALVVAVSLMYAAREGLGLRVPLPCRRRQVPQWWRNFFSPPVAAFLYGLGLGIGFLTFLTYGTYVAVSVAAVALGSPEIGALLLAPFGIGRGVSVLIAARTSTAAGPARVVDRLQEVGQTRIPRSINACVLASLASLSLIAVL